LALRKTDIPPPRYLPPDPRWFDETTRIALEVLRRYGEKPYVIIYGDGVYVGDTLNDVAPFISGSPRLGEIDIVDNPWDAIPHKVQFNYDLNEIIKGLEEIMNQTKNNSVKENIRFVLTRLKDMASWPEAYFKTNYMYNIRMYMAGAVRDETDPELKKKLEYYANILNNLKAERMPLVSPSQTTYVAPATVYTPPAVQRPQTASQQIIATTVTEKRAEEQQKKPQQTFSAPRGFVMPIKTISLPEYRYRVAV